MPLPPALAARLAKRGLIKSDESKKVENDEEAEEEVFVEHHDDHEEEQVEPEQTITEEFEDKENEEEILVHETINCPNKSNPYHECVDHCREFWGTKTFSPITELDSKRNRMLAKYPLPDTWLEVGDPETGRFYYWNTESDKVSWLSPLHPKAEESLPQEKLRDMERMAEESDSDSSSSSSSSGHSDVEEEEEHEMDIDDFEEIERRVLRDKREKEVKEQRQNVRRRREEALDPMDPAAYSDIPRGTWSSGLEVQGSAKTGVDSTASGPLFQQRPYPSPGAILRMNKPKD